MASVASKLCNLFTRYPREFGVCPKTFSGVAIDNNESHNRVNKNVMRISVESVPDKAYFLLFGAISKKLKSIHGGRSELVVVRGVNGAIGVGWLAELKRSAPVAWLSSGPWVRAYGKMMDGIAYRCATWSHLLSDLVAWVRADRLWCEMQRQPDGYSLRIEGIEVKDLLVDSYLRLKPSPVFNVRDPFVRRLVWQAIRDVRRAHAYFGRTKPLLYLTSYTTYLEHGIPARTALQHGVHVWAFGNLNQFGKRLTISDSYHTKECSDYRKEFDALDRQMERIQQAREKLENRMSGGRDLATCYMRQSAYAQTDLELPTGLKDAVVIFLHDFYDSPHVYAELVFNDFWSWICFTIEKLQELGAVFFLKPHPNQIALSDAALDDLRHKYPNLKWLSTSTSNVQLAQAGIACGITVYGTVAHELAYLGVPSIGCARHPHHSFDFCRTAKTQHEYESFLNSYSEMKQPVQEMQRQALAFYYMHNMHGNADQQKLRKAFVKFWWKCSFEQSEGELGMLSYQELIDLPAFDRFVLSMVDDRTVVEATS